MTNIASDVGDKEATGVDTVVLDVTNCFVVAILFVLPLSSSIAVLILCNSFLISFLTVSTSSIVDRVVDWTSAEIVVSSSGFEASSKFIVIVGVFDSVVVFGLIVTVDSSVCAAVVVVVVVVGVKDGIVRSVAACVLVDEDDVSRLSVIVVVADGVVTVVVSYMVRTFVKLGS